MANTVTLNTFAVAVIAPNGLPMAAVRCHNRATAEAIKAKAEREYLAAYGVPTTLYTIAVPGEVVIPAGI
jgi:formate-dependent nitrite reductase cytochrome c552 subunit